MAEIIPDLNQHTLSRMTSGEKRFARRLKELLEDDYLIWYDIPIGKQRRYPDFIILHPGRGLLFLEIKDWKAETIKKISKSDVELLTDKGLVTRPHPLEQVRQYTYQVIDCLSKDPTLQQTGGTYRSRLIMPYGWGCVFTNITRKQAQGAIPDDAREKILPDHLMIYSDEMTASADAEAFQEQLWGMFNYQFGNKLTLPQIDRIRWHLFPEIRIDERRTIELFGDSETGVNEQPETSYLPDIIKIMDVQQEQLARSLGMGHRVIHGVAGSGKTLILGYRCLHLAQVAVKPILVLCFNITLAARLRSFISNRGIGTQVQIYHFHDWCAQQLRTYHVDLIDSEQPIWERHVETVIKSVEKGTIPHDQYSALLIDEGHDFEAEWLKLITQMINPETGSLLLLYDDAQSIYSKKSGLDFSLSSVGIQARGRTTILRLNYRNTREILRYAYDFAKHYLDPRRTVDDDSIPLIKPEAAGASGPEPVLKQFRNPGEEVRYVLACIQKWHQNGIALKEIAVIYPGRDWGKLMASALEGAGIDCLLMASKQNKSAYDPGQERINILTIHSSKGLEFRYVILIGTGDLGIDEERIVNDARLLYVGMTRAQECLLITSSTESQFSQQLAASADIQLS